MLASYVLTRGSRLSCLASLFTILCYVRAFGGTGIAVAMASPVRLQEAADSLRSENPLTRKMAYRRLVLEATSIKDVKRRRYLVEKAVEAIRDRDADVREEIGLMLARLDRDMFTSSAVSGATRYLEAQGSPSYSEILLWGVLDLGCYQEQIDSLVQEWALLETEWRGGGRGLFDGVVDSRAWAAMLAKARKGDAAASTRVLSLVKSPAVTHKQRAHLLEDVAYLRNCEAMDLLREYVNSDVSTGAPEDGGEEADYAAPLWLYAAGGLSRALEKFPVSGHTPGEFAEHREQIRSFVNSYRGPWRIRGQANRPVAVIDTSSDRGGTNAVEAAAVRVAGRGANRAETVVSRTDAERLSIKQRRAVKIIAASICGMVVLAAAAFLWWRRC